MNINVFINTVSQTVQGQTGKLVLASYGQDPVAGKNLTPMVKHYSTDSVPEMELVIKDWTRQKNRNVYMPLVLMNPELKRGAKGGRDDIQSLFGLCADFDDDQAHLWKERLPAKPSFVMETSQGRYQAVYLFERPVKPETVKDLAIALKEYSNCDHGTKDLCHVWRIPGTLNWPNKKKVDAGRPKDPQEVKIAQAFTGYVDINVLRNKLPKQEPVKINKQIAPPPVDTASLLDNELLKKALKSQNGAKIQQLFNGDWSDYLSHSDADQALCNHLAFWMDRDMGRIDSAFRSSGLMREKWDKVHYSDGQTYGQATILKAVSSTTESYNPAGVKPIDTVDEPTPKDQGYWEKPVPLKETTALELPPDLLPGILGEIIKAVSIATETPLELAAGLILSVLGTACHGKFIVQVKPGYTEPGNIWVIVALDPANRKSTVLMKITRPLSEWERRKCKEFEPIIREAKSVWQNQQARLKSLRGKYGKAKQDELNGIEAEILEIENDLVEVPSYPQKWSQDVTTERLGSLMSEHDGVMSILSAEGGVFDIIGGRYSNGIPNLDLYLQSHSGDPVKVDRGSREPVYLDHPALSLGLSPQPDVLRGLVDKPGFRGRGLLARFLYLLPKTNLGYRKLESEPVSGNVENEYCELVYSLLDIEQAVDEQGEKIPYILKLSNKAYQEWLEFARVVEKDLREGGRFEYITDWAGKLPGAAARIAGLLHCAENPYQPWAERISLETMQRSLELASIFSSHALIAFDMMGADKALEQARKIWRWVERNRYHTFSKRDCFNALQGTFHKVVNMDEALKVLQERNYIQEIQQKTGGRPSINCNVNPELSKEW